jgi:hypothetical protein
MSTADYVIDILLILVIFRQLRARTLTGRSALLPITLVAYAGSHYLHHFAFGGNDLMLILLLTFVGIFLGALSAFTTTVWTDNSGLVLARAGLLAATSWVAGMGFRFAFAVWANSGSGGRSLTRYSMRHHVTSIQAWTTALVLMAFGEVLSRVAILQIRRFRVAPSAAPQLG